MAVSSASLKSPAQQLLEAAKRSAAVRQASVAAAQAAYAERQAQQAKPPVKQ